MNATMTRPLGVRARARSVELVLAHMHLRLGALALARVELETLAGLGALDTSGLIDLAEVRWRTGDLPGAGEVAVEALLVDEGDAVALVIASEAASARGRPTEARRLASLAIARAPDAIDAIFAGMPRSGVWPPDAAEPAPTAPTMFDRGPDEVWQAEAGPVVDAPAADDRAPAPAVPSPTLSLWGDDGVVDREVAAMPDPAREFEAGRAALVTGGFEEAAFRLGLALRLAPALAPAVLEVTEGARAAGLTIVRGDAYRLAGHEAEARREYAVAAHGGLPERRKRTRVRAKATSPSATSTEAPEATEAPESLPPTSDGPPDAAGSATDEAATVPGADDGATSPSTDETGVDDAADQAPSA